MTQDFIEDAAESLAQGGQAFLIVVLGEDSSIIHSCLDTEHPAALHDWLTSGHWNRILQEHLDSLDT
jgi:hypothetical protein